MYFFCLFVEKEKDRFSLLNWIDENMKSKTDKKEYCGEKKLKNWTLSLDQVV